jgi:DNA-binding CsgD family transcriptional regulator
LHRRAAPQEAGRVQVPRLGTPLALLVEPPAGRQQVRRGGGLASDGAPRPGCAEQLTASRSPAECCVAQRLCAGADLERIARDLAISRNTVRGHLKQIFCKTRSHRQAELICKLLSER